MAFRDKYTDFSYNGKTSEKMKVWITNNHDIKHAITPSFSNSFVNPTYGGASYLSGTTVTANTITLSCVAIGINKNEWRNIAQWLSPKSQGKLKLGFTEKFFNVKVSSAISGEMWVGGTQGKVFNEIYNVTFNVSFITVGDWAARSELQIISLGDDAVNFNYDSEFLMPNYLPLESTTITKPFAVRNGSIRAKESGGDRVIEAIDHYTSVDENVFIRSEANHLIRSKTAMSHSLDVQDEEGNFILFANVTLEAKESIYITNTTADTPLYFVLMDENGYFVAHNNSKEWRLTAPHKGEYTLKILGEENGSSISNTTLKGEESIQIYREGVPTLNYKLENIGDKCYFYIEDSTNYLEYTIPTTKSYFVLSGESALSAMESHTFEGGTTMMILGEEYGIVRTPLDYETNFQIHLVAGETIYATLPENFEYQDHTTYFITIEGQSGRVLGMEQINGECRLQAWETGDYTIKSSGGDFTFYQETTPAKEINFLVDTTVLFVNIVSGLLLYETPTEPVFYTMTDFLGHLISFENIDNFYDQLAENKLELKLCGKLSQYAGEAFVTVNDDDYSYLGDCRVDTELTKIDYYDLMLLPSEAGVLTTTSTHSGVLANTGTEYMYPSVSFYMGAEERTASFDIDETEHLSYTFFTAQQTFDYEGRSGMALYNDDLLENFLLKLGSASTSLIDNTKTYNRGILKIDSGNPELHLGKLESFITPSLEGHAYDTLKVLHFKKDSKNYNARLGTYAVSFSKRISENSTRYNEGEYDFVDNQVEFEIFATANVLINEDAENIAFLVHMTEEEAQLFKTNEAYYYTICDTTKIEINSEQAALELYTRDII